MDVFGASYSKKKKKNAFVIFKSQNNYSVEHKRWYVECVQKHWA